MSVVKQVGNKRYEDSKESGVFYLEKIVYEQFSALRINVTGALLTPLSIAS
jgi:hypothetical protein